MSILRLEAENLKRIKAVAIYPDKSPVVTVRGNNGQGKTSVLDAITYALGGKNVQPPEPIRRGEDSARVLLETEELIVERKWTANDKSTVTVRSKDGVKIASPQTLLDRLVGRLSFDPMEFMALPPREQAKALQEMVGDFSELDARRQALADRRAHSNKLLATIEAQLAPLKGLPETAAVSVKALVEKQTALTKEKEANDKLRALVGKEREMAEHLQRLIVDSTRDVARLKRDLEAAESTLASRTEEMKHATARIEAAEKNAAALIDPDLSEVMQALYNAETTNENARKCAERATLNERVAKGKELIASIEADIDACDVERAKRLAEAPFPVPGLGFGADGVTFNGLPLQQASSAEQLRVSLAMGLALNPQLKVLLLRDGSLLDENSLKLVTEMAAKAGAQVWMECVGKEGVGVVIEDGTVVSATNSAPPPPETF